MEKLEKEVSPEIELLFLKRNALFGCVMGVVALSSQVIYGVALLTLLVLLSLSFFRLIVALPNWKYLFWTGNCKDEYFNYLNNRAYRYATITSLFTCGFLYGLDMESVSGKSVTIIIGATTSFAYSLPLLYWLRGNDE